MLQLIIIHFSGMRLVNALRGRGSVISVSPAHVYIDLVPYTNSGIMSCHLLFAMFLTSYVQGGAFGVPLPPTTTTRADATPCPSHPLPTASASVLLVKLEPFLEEVAENISAALEEDKSPGGAVVSIVYNDTVIWTKGFGLINDSGNEILTRLAIDK